MRRRASYFIALLSNSGGLLAHEKIVEAFSFDANKANSPTFLKDRPLLRKFSHGINRRIIDSEEGMHRFGMVGAYTSEETFPCLDMLGSNFLRPNANGGNVSSRRAIRKAFTESNHIHSTNKSKKECGQQELPHGRSSGSGCTIIRLTGSDAAKIQGLAQYTTHFFDQVDNDECNDDVMNVGVFRIDNHVYAGFDDNVNGEGKMQFLDTRMLPSRNDIEPLLLPLEVGELVGVESLSDAQKGMDVLLDIGTQITSAVLDMDSTSAEKLIDDGTHIQQHESHDECNRHIQPNRMEAGDVSNSYHRLIRYLKPHQSIDDSDAAFQAHVDSSFLTLIPMPELPGLEIWCPSNAYNASIGSSESQKLSGEWVRPRVPAGSTGNDDKGDKCAYVIALAGQFLELTSDGQVPVCIHRVIPPKPPESNVGKLDGDQQAKYKTRVSAPMFLRPRRGESALLDVGTDLKLVKKTADAPSSFMSTAGHGAKQGLYFEEGLLDECDEMHLWSAHEIMKHK